MARKKKKSDLPTKRPEESRAAESVTVAWMLAMIATAIGEIGTLATWLIAVLFFRSDEPFIAIVSLPGLLLFIAVITGVVCLVLEPFAHRLRKSPIPFGVAWVARAIAILPILTLFLFVFLASG